MNTLFFLSLLVLISNAFLAQAHTDTHVRKVCGSKASKNIINICPPENGVMCSNGGYPSITEYCSMGFSDSQIRFMCCPSNELN